MTSPVDGAVVVRPYDPARDETWAVLLLDDELGGRRQARRGEVVDVLAGSGFVATGAGGDDRRGLLTYTIDGKTSCELQALVARPRGRGTGSRLVDALVGRLGATHDIWVVTTNDNLDALRLYQRRGFRLRALRPGAVDDARARLKSRIGRVGEHGIPLRDELELVRPAGVDTT